MNPAHQRDEAMNDNLCCPIPTSRTASAKNCSGSFTYTNIHNRGESFTYAYRQHPANIHSFNSNGNQSKQLHFLLQEHTANHRGRGKEIGVNSINVYAYIMGKSGRGSVDSPIHHPSTTCNHTPHPQ
ncbi:hypothetical protein BCR33DRAFT_712001 [Rhizoclosmatium globosum]|uniref:Uncharacterized protein n=1 Tax=Rhizoclosmatium globosum TaxID=329046 RepID=A0A1Y2CY39_9FUNG|nr:hypothetical protein BCR33DRAFT_712001 [Rhizoclosmatium globosum]|eukprot:ORY51806.1 hypothetical protein BCR33DRAFT_712001 [Rhizoclosmatium globosum]